MIRSHLKSQSLWRYCCPGKAAKSQETVERWQGMGENAERADGEASMSFLDEDYVETDLDRRFLEEDPEDEIPGTIIPDEDPFEEIDAPGTSTVQGDQREPEPSYWKEPVYETEPRYEPMDDYETEQVYDPELEYEAEPSMKQNRNVVLSMIRSRRLTRCQWQLLDIAGMNLPFRKSQNEW